MNTLKKQTLPAVIVCASLFATIASADTVETRNGARLVGKVTKIDGDAVVLSTDYAGTIAIKQSEVVSLQTDTPQFVRLSGGTVMQGTISSTGEGKIQVNGADGTVSTTVGKVAATWAPGAKDPAIASLERGWAYEASMDITGKSGNTNQLGTSAAVRATLKSSQDTLQFYTAYNRQETEKVKSADQFKAGVDYANNFSGKSSWYVRDEGGFDRVKDIELYNIAAAGYGYDFIKASKQTLTGRAGLSFRYEGYKTVSSEDVKSAGLDFGLNHSLELSNSKLVNRLAFVPSFEDFANYRFQHESYFELPLASTAWKLRLGVSNDYTSEPTKGVEKMDTTYFTRLVLNWK